MSDPASGRGHTVGWDILMSVSYCTAVPNFVNTMENDGIMAHAKDKRKSWQFAVWLAELDFEKAPSQMMTVSVMTLTENKYKIYCTWME